MENSDTEVRMFCLKLAFDVTTHRRSTFNVAAYRQSGCSYLDEKVPPVNEEELIEIASKLYKWISIST